MSPRTPPGQTREQIYRFIRRRLLEGLPPTVREVQKHFGFQAVQTAQEHLRRLVAEGRLVKQKGKARGYSLPGFGTRAPATLLIPLLGRVQAGGLHAAIEECEGYIPVQARARPAGPHGIDPQGIPARGTGPAVSRGAASPQGGGARQQASRNKQGATPYPTDPPGGRPSARPGQHPAVERGRAAAERGRLGDEPGGHGQLFALRVQGESMTGAGILPGDIVIVRSQPTAQSGDIVVALIGDEATVKTLRIRRKRIELHAANPAFEPIVPAPGECTILGKVIEMRRHIEAPAR